VQDCIRPSPQMVHLGLIAVVGAIPTITASPYGQPFATLKRQANPATKSLQVDLGYEIYQGVANSSTGLNTYKGQDSTITQLHLANKCRIRFAAPPIGSLRWQAPQPPASNRSSVITASSFASQCPQSPNSQLPATSPLTLADEDCLFLNVYAPSNASNLPVLVWIHGGGYGAGNGQQDMSAIINANNNGFVGVAIQYRVSWVHTDVTSI
jgi:hypothetical protein